MGELRNGGPLERAAAQDLLPQIYEELRALAEGFLRDERAGHTLQPTALVHEAYLRVLKQSGVRWKNPGHLRAVSAQAMRRVLVDHARAKRADKRGGAVRPVTLVSELLGLDDGPGPDVLSLEAALEKLTTLDERRARIVELRFFGGLTIPETAVELGISETTVEDDWRFARAWLNRELSA
jgi:RNA polymerase sigma factor (TIGR02999 family)